MKIATIFATILLSLFVGHVSASESSIPADSTDIVKFDPPTMDLEPSMNGKDVFVTLRSQPSGMVILNLETTEYLRAEECRIVFGPGNYTEKFKVTLYSAGSILTTTKTQSVSSALRIKINSIDSRYNQKIQSYKVNRKFVSSAGCQITGDPHFKTFDNSLYTFYGVANQAYHAVKSDRFNVQIRHYACHPVAHCASDVAIRFQDSVILVNLDEEGSEIPQFTVENYGPKGRLYVTAQNSQMIRVRTVDGSSVFIKFNQAKKTKKWMSNIHINVPGIYSRSVDGLCGNYDGQEDKFIDVKRKETTGINPETYAVISNEELFMCKDKCGGYKVNPTGRICIAHDVEIKNNSTMLIRNETVTPEKVPVPDIITRDVELPKVQINGTNNGTQYCSTVFQNLSCMDLKGEYYVRSCMSDAEAGLDVEDVARGLMATFQAACSSRSLILAQSQFVEDRKVATALQYQYNMQVVVVERSYQVNRGCGCVQEVITPPEAMAPPVIAPAPMPGPSAQPPAEFKTPTLPCFGSSSFYGSISRREVMYSAFTMRQQSIRMQTTQFVSSSSSRSSSSSSMSSSSSSGSSSSSSSSSSFSSGSGLSVEAREAPMIKSSDGTCRCPCKA
jgi:hypothetical protein